MKLIYIIFFLTSIVVNELVFDILLFQDSKISLCENPIESQSEKENKDVAENEAEVYYFTTSELFPHSAGNKINALIKHNSSIQLIPYLEIHSPPPE